MPKRNKETLGQFLRDHAEVVGNRVMPKMPVIFTSHVFIEELKRCFPNDYAAFYTASTAQDRDRTLNSQVGTFLSSHQEQFGIEKTRRVSDTNIRGNKTDNQEWQKIMHR